MNEDRNLPVVIATGLFGFLTVTLGKLLDAKVLITAIVAFAVVAMWQLAGMSQEDRATYNFGAEIIDSIGNLAAASALTAVFGILLAISVASHIISTSVLLRRLRAEGTVKAELMTIIDPDRIKSRGLSDRLRELLGEDAETTQQVADHAEPES